LLYNVQKVGGLAPSRISSYLLELGGKRFMWQRVLVIMLPPELEGKDEVRRRCLLPSLDRDRTFFPDKG
jgi:hypothetical protein